MSFGPIGFETRFCGRDHLHANLDLCLLFAHGFKRLQLGCILLFLALAEEHISVCLRLISAKRSINHHRLIYTQCFNKIKKIRNLADCQACGEAADPSGWITVLWICLFIQLLKPPELQLEAFQFKLHTSHISYQVGVN